MIEFHDVEKQYGSQFVLNGVSFAVHPGERVGVVGPNGAGKSTIFKLITGELSADRGEIRLPRDLRLGHLHQQLNPHSADDSLLSYTLRQPDLDALHDEIIDLETAAAGRLPDSDLHRLGDLQHRFETQGGYEIRSRAESALGGLGFRKEEFDRPFGEFSGGWQMRAELVRTLIGNPDVLLLDEPSNYLDLPAVEWVQRFLRDFAGTFLLISHDRYLLRTLAGRILEVQNGGVTRYAGGYDYYIEERERRRQQMEAAYRNDLARRTQLEQFIHRFRAQATKAAQVQSRIKMLEKMEAPPQPARPPDLSHLRIASPPHCGARLLRLQEAGFTYDGHHWIFRGVNLEIERGEKIALVGYNGMGKTTLLRSLAAALPLTEGDRKEGYGAVIGYQSQDFSETFPAGLNVLDAVYQRRPAGGEREIRTLLGSFGFQGESVLKPCDALSGGERIRLAFACLFARPPNLLLLDEPTTHLDIHGREALEIALHAYPGAVCLVSHDVTFVRHVANRVIALSPSGVAFYPGGYDYYLEKTGRPPDPVRSERTTRPAVAGRPDKASTLRRREAERTVKRLEREIAAYQAEHDALRIRFEQAVSGLDYTLEAPRLVELQRRIGELEAQWVAAMNLCEA
jgi:ATP-binding cassette subfamily F protein 3